MTEGVVVLAGTPIGDVGDASPALVRELVAAEVIAAEDTRRLRAMLRRLEVSVTAEIVSHFDANETERVPQLLQRARDGQRVLVVTDAGMPCVSDPGYRVVAAAAAEGLRVTTIAGPSAVVAALAVSGLPSDRFCFEGFAPRKPEQRAAALRALATEPRTMVFFEAPHRLAAFLHDAATALGGERRGVVCRELTKTHEEIRRDTLTALAEWADDGVRGEITIVIAGAATTATSLDDAHLLVADAVASGEKLSAACARIARETGLHKRDLYNHALTQQGASRDHSG